jgi:lipopolysaccharide heptosyltransferase II
MVRRNWIAGGKGKGLKRRNKILLVHTGGIGDLIMARPAIQFVYEKYQSAVIDFMGNPGSLKILMHDTWINMFIPIPSKRKSILNMMRILVILLKIRLEKYDYLFLLQPVLNKNSHRRLRFFASMISAKKTIGRSSNFGNNFLDVKVPENADIHEVERMLSVVSENKMKDGSSYEYYLSETFGGKIDHIPYAMNKPFAVLSPGGAKKFRRWPVVNFLELTQRFHKMGMAVVIIGDDKERDIISGRGEHLPEGTLNLIGETDLEQLIAIIRKSSIVIANDSGPMHLANALRISVVGIFGSGDSVRTRPYIMDKARVADSSPRACKPCYRQECKSPHCMDEISVDSVWKAATDLLNE